MALSDVIKLVTGKYESVKYERIEHQTRHEQLRSLEDLFVLEIERHRPMMEELLSAYPDLTMAMQERPATPRFYVTANKDDGFPMGNLYLTRHGDRAEIRCDFAYGPGQYRKIDWQSKDLASFPLESEPESVLYVTRQSLELFFGYIFQKELNPNGQQIH